MSTKKLGECKSKEKNIFTKMNNNEILLLLTNVPRNHQIYLNIYLSHGKYH